MDDFADSGWRVLLALLIALAFVPTGAYAAHLARAAPLTNGALAGLGAFLVWLPLRLLIWVTRNGDQGLVAGHDPVFRPGQLFGFLVISTALGMLGGFVASRRRAHDDPGGGSLS
jgi:membrane protease YdiL (CAAX protease family)